jgi:hypothetical protein
MLKKQVREEELARKILEHLARQEVPVPQSDIVFAVSPTGATEPIKRILMAMVDSGLISRRTGTSTWQFRGQERRATASLHRLTAKGRRAAATGRIPPLSGLVPHRPKALGSTATPLREKLSGQVIAYLRSHSNRAAASDIVQEIGVATSDVTIRDVLRALVAEGVLTEKTVARTSKVGGPDRAREARYRTRVYSLVRKPTRPSSQSS